MMIFDLLETIFRDIWARVREKPAIAIGSHSEMRQLQLQVYPIPLVIYPIPLVIFPKLAETEATNERLLPT